MLDQIPTAVNSLLIKGNQHLQLPLILKRKLPVVVGLKHIAEIYAEEGGTPHLDRRHTVLVGG